MPKLSLKVIQRQIDALTAKAEKLKTRDKKPAIRQIAAIMRKHDLTIADLKTTGGGAKRGPKPKAKAAKRSGRKVAAMYKNTKTGETWSGRGRPARWLAAAEKAGRKRTEFLIKKS